MSSNLMKTITTETAPQPFGRYAQAAEVAGIVSVSGQLAARADGNSLPDQPFAVPARQALANMIEIVEVAGPDRDRIAKVTAYLVGVGHWPAFDTMYAEINVRPARCRFRRYITAT